jgi:biotin carboxyl carrier protein
MRTYHVSCDGHDIEVVVTADGRFTIGEKAVDADIRQTGPAQYSVLLDGRSYAMLVSGARGAYRVVVNSLGYDVSLEDQRHRLLKSFERGAEASTRRTEIRAPMPALVVRIEVAPGDTVAPGKGLVILEAMKMENEIKAHTAGVVKEILVSPGKAVEKNELLMVFE